MSVITNKLPSSLESYLLNNSDSKDLNESNNDQSVNSSSNNGNYYIMDYEPTGSITNTSAVSIPYSSNNRKNQRIRLNSINSPSSFSLSSTTANGSITHQNLKESLNKTLASLMENCQEKVIIYNSSPSSSYSFTKHSTIIYSPTKKSPLTTSSVKLNPSQNNSIFSIDKIKPSSLKKESKLSEITFGLNKEKLLVLKKSNNDNDTTKKVDTKLISEQEEKVSEKKEEPVKDETSSMEKKEDAKVKVETEMETESTVEVKGETDVNSEMSANNETEKNSKSNVENETKDKKNNSKSESLAKLETKKDKELLKRKKMDTHKKTLSFPNILAPLTPLSAINEVEPPLGKIKRKKSVNFSSDSFKSICVFTTTDKPENIKNSKVEVKTDDPNNDTKDKDFTELRNYESAWSPVPRNVIHTQKFKSSKDKHSHYELPVSIQSFKLVQSTPEETEDKLTCLKVNLNVQNLNYEKKVIIRYTVNKWKSFEEVEAKYKKCIREATKDEGDIKGVVGLDCFVARIPVGKYFVLEEKPGHICNQRPTKMLLVARYEVNNNTYWDNNDFTDYHIELVRINAGYDVPRVSKNGKPIPCPGCSMSAKQSHIIEKKGNEVKNNKRTVRKIGGVYGNFTEAVTKDNDRTNFMADKKKVSLYMGMDGNKKRNSSGGQSNSKTSITNTTSSKVNSEVKIASVLTEEPQSIVGNEEKTKTMKKVKGSKDSIMRSSYSYNFGSSPSLGGSPMFSMLGGYSPMGSSNNNSTSTTTNATTTHATTSSTFISSYTTPSSTSSKYNPPMSTVSSFSSIPSTTTTTSSYNPSSYSTPSKYELSPYSGGLSYDPSAYGNYPSNSNSISSSTSTAITNPTTTTASPNASFSSKYNPPNEYPGSSYSKYDPPSYYNKNSYSTPTSPSSNSSYNHYGSPGFSSSPLTKTMNSNFSRFSDYNFGNNLIKKAKKVTGPSMNYSTYNVNQKSKYDIPFSTFSSFGDNFSNYYSMSPSAVTY